VPAKISIGGVAQILRTRAVLACDLGRVKKFDLLRGAKRYATAHVVDRGIDTPPCKGVGGQPSGARLAGEAGNKNNIEIKGICK
jgi:hypothetical protein